jgi:hypothetical protein
MKYQAMPCDDGRWFVYNSETDQVFAYAGNELLARKVVRMLNQSPSDRLDDLEDLDPTKMH